MDNLKEIREQINGIDDVITGEFVKRLDLSAKIAEEKSKTDKPVYDPEREREVLYRLTGLVPEEYRLYVKELYETVFACSKARQTAIATKDSETTKTISKIIAEGLTDLPARASVACQGTKGANSGTAAAKIFPLSDVTYFRTFEGVFGAVDGGLSEFGILPIENSTAGSVLEVYDLMKKYNFHIVRSVRIKIEHCLAAVKGAKLSDIKKVVSHPQALSQCKDFIEKHSFITEESENTAVAAKSVKDSGDKSVAVLCSYDCAELYGLEVLERGAQDNAYNYTRFICIAKDLKIYKGSDKISVMTALSHKPGTLNRLLMHFSTLGLNLTKIESRPIAGTDFEFMFYFDFEGDVEKKEVLSLISELENGSDKFVFLGSYKEEI